MGIDPRGYSSSRIDPHLLGKMGSVSGILEAIIDRPLSLDEAQELAYYLLNKASDVEIAAILAALRARGEAPSEVAGFSLALRRAALRINVDKPILDTAGTGGDGSSTINVSTASALLAAYLGARVVKHGNRSASGRSGSADLMESLGYNITHPPSTAECMIRRVRFTFLYAPLYHKLMAHVMPVRRKLGIRTIFNLAGPLANPAEPNTQILGVSDPQLVDVMSNAGPLLGYDKLVIVHGYPRIDEVSVSGPTMVAESGKTGKRKYTVTPEELGIEPCPLEELRINSPSESALRIINAMKGRGRRCDVSFIAANTGMAIYAAGLASTPQRGVSMALDALESGNVAGYIDAVIDASKGCTG